MEITEVLEMREILEIILSKKKITHRKECRDLLDLMLVNKKFYSVVKHSVLPSVGYISSSIINLRGDVTEEIFTGILHISIFHYFSSNISIFTRLGKLEIGTHNIGDELRLMTNLTNLRISDTNGPSALDTYIEKLTKLETLSIHSNTIMLPESISRLTNLTSLELTGFNLKDKDFQNNMVINGLKSLSILRCQSIDYRFLQNMSSLVTLDFDGESLEYAPLTQITKLTLRKDSDIFNYPNKLQNLTYLSLIEIDIPTNVTSLTRLTTFHFRKFILGDNFEQFQDVLYKIPNLTDISIWSSRRDERCFIHINHMTRLRSIISHIPIDMTTMPTLSSLTYLTLPQDISLYIKQRPLPKLKYLFVEFEEPPNVTLFHHLPSLKKLMLKELFLDESLSDYFYQHYIKYSLFS